MYVRDTIGEPRVGFNPLWPPTALSFAAHNFRKLSDSSNIYGAHAQSITIPEDSGMFL